MRAAPLCGDASGPGVLRPTSAERRKNHSTRSVERAMRSESAMANENHQSSEIEAKGNWTVWRIDDNGNTFVVREHVTREEAERLVTEFTARGHKQMYWAEAELT